MSPLRFVAIALVAGPLAACSSSVQRFDYPYGGDGRPYARLGVPSRIVVARAGDTVPSLAARYSTEPATIRAMNKLKGDRLTDGQEIAVPYHRP